MNPNVKNILTTSQPFGIWGPTGDFVVVPQNNLPPMDNSDEVIPGYVSTCLPMGNRPFVSYCSMMYGGGSSGVEMQRMSCPKGYGKVKCGRF